MTIQEKAAQALTEYRKTKDAQERQHNENAARETVALVKRMLDADAIPNTTDGTTSLDGLTFRKRHDPDSTTTYLEVTADGWGGSWECVWDMAGLGRAIEAHREDEYTDYPRPDAGDNGPAYYDLSDAALIARKLVDLIDVLKCFQNFKP